MFYQYPDEYYYGRRGPHSYSPYEYERLRQQKSYEQMRRRQILEEQQRREQLMRLREAEKARRRRNEYERPMATREVSTRRRDKPSYEERNGTEYTVVQGWDGRLYRVPIDDGEQRIITDWDSPTRPVRRNGRHISRSTARGHENPLSDEDSVHYHSENTTRMKQKTQSCKPTATQSEDLETKSNATENYLPKKDKRKSKKITVIVEDVSDDSDNDNDELKSIWRNRHPSPSESWMEPIEL